MERRTLHTSGSLAVRTASVESTCLFLRQTKASSVVNKHSAALFYSPNQDVRMTMQGYVECLLDDYGFKHTDIQIQRRSARHGRTPGFKRFKFASWFNDENRDNEYTKTETTRRNTGLIRRKTESGS